MTRLPRLRSWRAGFTLTELTCVVVLLGLLVGLSVSLVKDAVPNGLDRNAVALANAVNAAKKSYELRVSTASGTWAAAASDNARFLLIRDRIPYAESLTLAEFSPAGYSLGLGASLDSRVTVTGPHGSIAY